MEEIAVSVLCLVYNHEKYLRKCLDGFVNQKTNFKFEVIIHDDASTDNSVDIIKEYETKYPDIIKPIYQTENQYSKGVKITNTILFPRARGKYIAFCEGDDYWCDEHKLQKQYDVMESNPECHFCVHKVCATKENGELLNQYYPNFALDTGAIKTERFMEIIGIAYQFQTSSYFIRTADMKEYVNNTPEFVKVADVGDEPMMLYFGHLGDVYYIDEIMSCYRRNSIGSWSLRMKSDSKNQLLHYNLILEMYDAFNEFTDNKYEKQLSPRRKVCYLTKYALNLDDPENAKILLKKENRDFLKRHSIKYRVYVVLKAYAPKIADFYYRIRK